MNTAKRRIRQTEIAAAAGVSVSTVSRALAGVPGISEEVRNTILKIAQDLGYPLAATPSPALGNVTALISAAHDLSIGGIYQIILDGIREAAAAHGVQFSVALREHKAPVPAYMFETPETGVFFIGLDPNEAALDQILAKGNRVVLVNGLDPELRVDAVAPSNFFGGRLAARYLVGLGHRKLLHVTTRRRWTLNRRAQGFEIGAKELAPDADVEILDVDALDAPHVLAAAERRFAEGDFDRTAVFCGNDIAALGFIQALRARGLRTPEDVSVVGFDDLPIAALCNPPLTTIRVDWNLIGREAVRLMIQRHEDPARSAVQLQVGATLVPRESVQPVP